MRLLAAMLCLNTVGPVWLSSSFCRLAIAIEELAKASSLLQDKLQVRI